MLGTKKSVKSISDTRNSPTGRQASLTLKELREAYKRADEFCGEVQNFTAEAGIPAMNELRNAGHHLLNAISDDGHLISDSEIISATNHARRACYEASEAGINWALLKINDFKETYREVQITKVLPDYINLLENAQKAQVILMTGRQDDYDRSADHNHRMEIFATLRSICNRLDITRIEANKLLDEKQADYGRQVSDSRKFFIGLMVTLFFGIVSIILALK